MTTNDPMTAKHNDNETSRQEAAAGGNEKLSVIGYQLSVMESVQISFFSSLCRSIGIISVPINNN